MQPIGVRQRECVLAVYINSALSYPANVIHRRDKTAGRNTRHILGVAERLVR